jgi:hypothetical protein
MRRFGISPNHAAEKIQGVIPGRARKRVTAYGGVPE